MKRMMDLDRRLALIGAEARIQELQSEVSEIYRRYPELRGRRQPGTVPHSSSSGKRRKTSAAGRRAVSEGMRRYWAKRKARAKAAKRASS